MPSIKKDVDDTTFMSHAARTGQPSRSQLEACRKLQVLYREQKGKSASLYRIAKAKGMVGSSWLAQAEAAAGGRPKTKARGKPRRDRRRSQTPSRKATTRVGSGHARRLAARRSDGPLIALGALMLGVTGVALSMLLRQPPAASLAQASPAPSASAAAQVDATPAAWHARQAAEDRAALRAAEEAAIGEAELDAAAAAEVAAVAEAVAESEPAPTPAPTAAPQDPQPQPEPVEDAEADADAEEDAAVLLSQGADLGASTVLDAAHERRLDAEALLFEVYRHYDAEDAEALAPLVVELEALDAGRQADCARGLLRFLQEDFPGVLEALEPIEDLDGYRERDALARAAMFLGRFDLARGALDADDPDAARILTLLDGPFRERYPLGAPATETMTPDGHYRVITDLGLDMATLDAFERKLEQTPAAGRQALVDKFRAKHEGLHEVAAVMDKAHRAYTKLFATEPKAKIKPTVFVFSEEADFHGFSTKLNIGSTENVLGYYVPRYRVLVFYDQARGPKRPRIGDETLNVLLHETFHQWLHLYVEGAPHWFNEGLAEYFGIAKMTRKQLHYGLVPEGYPSRLHNIRWALTGQIQAPMPLSRLLRADRETFMGPQAAINYATAWSFVHFMASSRDGRDLLRDYFRALQAGLGLEEAYTEVFGDVDMTALQARWKDYTLNLK